MYLDKGYASIHVISTEKRLGFLNKSLMVFIILSTVLLIVFNISFALSWLYAWFFIILRRELRAVYLDRVAKSQSFNIALFILYTIFSFIIPIGSVFIAFLLPQWLEPRLILIALVVEYIDWVGQNIKRHRDF